MIPENKLRSVVQRSNSFNDVARKLRTTRPTVQRWVKKYGIDYSHFTFGGHYQDLVGKKINKLTVMSVFEEPKPPGQRDRRFRAICKCECGNEKIFRCDYLRHTSVYSCGCHAKDRWNMVCEKNPAFKGVGEIRKVFFSDMRHAAVRRGLQFTVTMNYIWKLYEKQNRRCAITGLPIHFGRARVRHETTASLDRIDSRQGYIKGNVRWLLKDINMLRLNYDTEYFIKLCNAVALANPRKLNENDMQELSGSHLYSKNSALRQVKENA